MAWSLVAATSKAAGTNPTTPAINTTGADLIVLITTLDGTTLPSVSDSLGNTWTQAVASAQNRIGIWYCQSPTTGSAHTFTATTSSNCFFMVEAWSGSTASPLDLTSSGTITNAASAQPGAITPSVNNELLVSAVWFSGAVTSLAVDSSLTIDETDLNVGADAYFTQTTAASINPTWSWTTSRNSVAAIVSFKPATGGSGETLSMAATWPDWAMSANVGAGRALSAADTWPDFTMSASVQAGRALSAAAIWPDWTMADTATAGRVLSAADIWPDWIMAANVIGPTASNIQLIAKRGHQTPGQPLGFV